MIQARFDYAGDLCTGCTVSGHAEYANPGEDVVCAAVSSAVQMAANLMTEIFRLPIKVFSDSETSVITIQLFHTDKSGNAAKLFAGLRLQLEQIRAEYPAYLRIETVESK